MTKLLYKTKRNPKSRRRSRSTASRGYTEKCIRETKEGYYELGISPIDTTLPIKKDGVAFRLGFFQQTVFQAAGASLCPLKPPRGRTEKSITQHFFPRVKHAPTRPVYVCVTGRTHGHAASGCRFLVFFIFVAIIIRRERRSRGCHYCF